MKSTLGGSSLLLTVCMMGCGPYVARRAASGDRYFNQHKYREAAAEYVKAVRFDDQNEHVLRQLGLSYYELGNLKDAFEVLSKAEGLKPNDWEVRVAVGQLDLANRRPEQALREAQAVLAAEPNQVPALDLLASTYLIQKDFAKAVVTYRRLADRFPNASDRHYMLGVALLGARQGAEALKEFETTVSLDPNNAAAAKQVVDLDLQAGRPDDALAQIEKQLAAAGRNPKLLMLLASVQDSRGDRTAAEAAYREAGRLDPSHSDARLELANFDVEGGKLDDAMSQVDSALTVEKTPTGYQLRGIIYQLKGNPQSARQAFEQALALDPRYAPAANNLAWVLSEKLGDLRRAYTVAVSAYQSFPDDPHIQDTLGWILYKLGQNDRALGLLKTSAEKLPDDPGVQYHLGMALLTKSDTADARRALGKAVSSPTAFDDRAAAKKGLESLH